MTSNSYLSIAFQRQRDARGFRLLHRRGAMEEVSKIFRANGTLILMLDQRAFASIGLRASEKVPELEECAR